MNLELKQAMDVLEKEKHISSTTLFDAIEQALVSACRNNYKNNSNITVQIDRETCDYHVYAEKTIVATREEVTDPQFQIAACDLEDAHVIGNVGDKVKVDVNSQSFGRIATQTAKNVILQKIREEERSATFNYYSEMVRTVVTGTVQRQSGKSWSINLGRIDGVLNETEQIPGEELRLNDRIKVYVVDVRKTNKGATRVLVSRTHKDLVRELFKEEVAEIRDGVVEIMSIAREAGSRSKIAVWSNNPNVDPVGACVGLNGTRVNSIVDELCGEKIDIVSWDDNPGNLIQNALSPAKIVAVFADPEERSAKVVVPDNQLSLAIGREGQNARLAARLTGYKIDIKSESQAKDAPGFRYEDYLGGDDEDDYDEPQYDENGELIEDDEEVEYRDQYGRRVAFDEDGNPYVIPEEDEDAPVTEDGAPVDGQDDIPDGQDSGEQE